MLNVQALKAEIVRNGLTQSEFCKKMGMSHSTFVRKMKLGNVTTDEATKMIRILKLKNPAKIFFANKLT